ncbi:MAG: PEP-CTERM sorting domain-containing protein [Verrucomicrobia bacterium]|nr:PEP-CTERM sorting domain-containing protein [Verrucomicrobiota bacterium]
MTKTKAHLTKSIAVLTASFLLGTTGYASLIYDNTDAASSKNKAYAPPGGNVEFGDQVFLSGSERRITDFSFDYFLSASPSGNEQGQLFFYKNDGGATASEPGTLLYQSGTFNLSSGFQRLPAQGLSIDVPNTFTWTVKFSGIDLGETAGLLVYDPPAVGASLDDFWVKNTSGGWSTFLIDANTPANFGARITAVPEPTTMALGLLGGLALLANRIRRKA